MRKSFHRRIDISFCPQYIRKERRSGDDQAAPDQSRLRVCLLLRLRRGRGGGGRGREDSGQRSEDYAELAAGDENIAIEQSKFISEKDNFEAFLAGVLNCLRNFLRHCRLLLPQRVTRPERGVRLRHPGFVIHSFALHPNCLQSPPSPWIPWIPTLGGNLVS